MNKKSLYAALISSILPTLFVLGYFVFFPDPPVSRVLYVISRFFFIGLPILWTLFVEKKKFPLPRFSQKGMRAGILTGLAVGITAMILYINVFANILDLSEVNNKTSQLGFGGKNFLFFKRFRSRFN